MQVLVGTDEELAAVELEADAAALDGAAVTTSRQHAHQRLPDASHLLSAQQPLTVHRAAAELNQRAKQNAALLSKHTNTQPLS